MEAVPLGGTAQVSQAPLTYWRTPLSNDPSASYRLFYTLFNQAGGTMVADEGREVVLTKDAFIRVAEFLRSLTHDLALAPKSIDNGGVIALFTNQRTGFHWGGGFDRPTFLDAGVPFGLKSYPRVFEKHVAWDGTHDFVIPALEGGGADRIQAAMHFIRGMVDRSVTWAEGGHIPTYTPAAQSEAFRTMPAQYEDLPADGVVYEPKVWYAGSGSQLQVVVGSAVASVIANFSSPEAAYAEARRGVEELARTTPPH